MIWHDCKLGDVVTLQRGHDLPESQRQSGTVPVVTSSGITGWHNEAKAKAPGVVTGRCGTLGEVYFIHDDYWPHNTALYVKDFKGNDPRFIAYFLKNSLRSYHSDKAAVPGVDRNVLHAMKIRIPDRQVQVSIANALSAYDNLLENNRRRIALLEESARHLYQEWFVRHRFPGHEHTRTANDVPDGWKRCRLDQCITLKRGHDLPEGVRVAGNVPVVSSSGITGYHDAKKADGPGIVTGRCGTLGRVYYVEDDYWPHNTALYVVDFKGHSPRFVYFALQHALQSAQSNNAATPGLNRNVLHAFLVLWPARGLHDRFDEFAKPVFKQLAALAAMNENLRAARDLLLPRLMSGEVAV